MMAIVLVERTFLTFNGISEKSTASGAYFAVLIIELNCSPL
jgi:hypothetical protein